MCEKVECISKGFELYNVKPIIYKRLICFIFVIKIHNIYFCRLKSICIVETLYIIQYVIIIIIIQNNADSHV